MAPLVCKVCIYRALKLQVCFFFPFFFFCYFQEYFEHGETDDVAVS